MVKVPERVLQPSLSATLQNPDTQVKTLFMKMLRIESLFLKKVDKPSLRHDHVQKYNTVLG